ncbi:alkylation response protein AidB-like acyl-CoA dehydrogenase [Thermocatellispora tengchongensis]|uniref:Alkylation response protein AidB-like acyl-CoA dehydrogenase n=1 Tax=Thermocatellispora tengchongensis TaxID=1073253 RepID=A0A840PFB7_9ACTN|nr:acyl-CoA dehydrogenase family protein [Thermocatellispora tengchongensis]MBB5140114.1 alkylation response protein AidB-like acyl-CoA dehydrogenase [Thermocatellispora tengchongensis]
MTVLSPDHLALRKATREFAENEVAPIAARLDLQDETIPEDLLAKMADLGLFGVTLPAEYGGLGSDIVALGVVTEELTRVSLSVGSLIQRNIGCGHILNRFGTEEQKARYLEGIATGRLLTASAGTEPDAGSDAANIKTMAVRARGIDGGEVYRVTGTKQWCTFADRADLIFTLCRTGEDKHGGISSLIVEKPAGGFDPPRLTGTRIPTAGYHGMYSYTLHFDELEVPAANLVGGEEGQGFRQLMGGYEIARIGFAFRCIGLARGAYEAALDYVRQRRQFDRPIAEFQAVRFRLADMRTQIDAARALAYNAAVKASQGVRADLEAGEAKLFASEMARKVAWEALYLHGGNGYAVDSPVNRYWRDSGLLPIGEGTSDIQREIIARRILADA